MKQIMNDEYLFTDIFYQVKRVKTTTDTQNFGIDE